MRVDGVALAAGVLLLLAGCGPTAEEQRAMDGQSCLGYGFAPGTDAFAGCMMNTAQQRDAEAAANRRASLARQAQDDRARQDREAADRARRDDEDQRRRDDVQRTMSGSTGIGMPGMDMPDIGHMNCTSASSGNAGSLSCH